MMVIDHRHAEVRGALPELGQKPAQALVVVGHDRTPLRALVDDLQEQPAGVAHELRVLHVQRELLLLASRID